VRREILIWRPRKDGHEKHDFIRATDTEYASRIIAAKNEALAAAAAERTLATEQRALAAEQMAAAAAQRALAAEQVAAATEQRAVAAAAALKAVHASRSWRVTAPLRAVGRILRRS